MSKQEKSVFTRELTGTICLVSTILVACSLLSYDWHDVSLNNAGPASSKNWIGPVGAYLGLMAYGIVGWSANLIPLLTLYLGASALFRPAFRLLQSSLWMLGFIFMFSCLSQVLGGESSAWARKINNVWVGGYWGYYFGKAFLMALFGKVGSIIITLGGTLASFYLCLQLAPKEIYLWVDLQLSERRTMKRQKALQTGDLRTVLRTREEEIAERQRLIERELARRGRNLRGMKEAPTKPPAPEPEPKAVAKPEVEEKPPEKVEKPEYVINRPPPKKKVPRPLAQPMLFGSYTLPSLDLLMYGVDVPGSIDSKEDIAKRGAIIETTLKDFGIEVQMGEITQGATITRYEVVPSPGVKVERIVNLQNNLSLALKADRVNILAPVAGKGTVGIEVANKTKAPVLIRELIESAEFQQSKAKIPLALGKDVYGKTLIADLAEMPHLLIAGSTGAGKSVCINSIISSLLYKFSPEQLRLILIDPKVVELQIYNSLPHLVVPVVSDPKKVIVALRWVIREMEKRYAIMAKVGVRNITAFNIRPKDKMPVAKIMEVPRDGPDEEEEVIQPSLLPDDDVIVPEKLPFIVVFIDELADLMLTAPVDAEDAITRITQMARAAGIHLVVATQTPRADVVTGTIKTNLPSKIAFRVASKIDSRVILDENGAENLLGKGDMIYKSSDSSTLRRAQGAFISDEEVRTVVDVCAKQIPASYDLEIHEKLSKPASNNQEASDEDEELVTQCMQVIRQENRASTSLLQRRLRLGYTRAARIMDLLQERGVVGPAQGSKDREILMRLDGAPPEG